MKRNIWTSLTILMIALVVGTIANFCLNKNYLSTVSAEDGGVVLYEVYPSASSTGYWNSQYVVLKNTSSNPIDISNYSIQFISAKARVSIGFKNFPSGTILGAGQYCFIYSNNSNTNIPLSNIDPFYGHTSDEEGYDKIVANKYCLSFPKMSTPGKNSTILLCNSKTLITINNFKSIAEANSQVVDAVGYGTSGAYFTAQANAPSVGYTLKRVDYLNDNSKDFALQEVKFESANINSLSYLWGVVQKTYNSLNTIQNLDIDSEVSCQAQITNIENNYLTIEDLTAGVLVDFETNVDLDNLYKVGDTITFNAVVKSNTQAGDKKLTILDAEKDNVVVESSGIISSQTIEMLTKITNNSENYYNEYIHIEGVVYDSEKEGISSQGVFVELNDIEPENNGKTISFNAIVRKTTSGYYLEYIDGLKVQSSYSYGQLQNVRTLADGGDSIIVCGYVSYVDKSIVIQDTSAGIGVSFVNTQSFKSGDFVVVSGVKNTTNQNIVIENGLLIDNQSTSSNTKYTQISITDANEIDSTKLDLDVYVSNAVIKTKNSNKNMIVTIGSNDIQLILDYSLTTISEGDEIKIMSAVPYYSKINATDYTIFIKANLENVEQSGYNVGNGLNKYESGDNVSIHGTITMVDAVNKSVVIYSGNKGIIVKLSDVSSLNVGDGFSVKGIYTKQGESSFAFIDGESYSLSVAETITPQSVALSLICADPLTYQSKTVTVNKSHTLIKDGKLVLAYNKNETIYLPLILKEGIELNAYECISLTGVVYQVNDSVCLYVNNSSDITNEQVSLDILLTDSSYTFEETGGKSVITNGIVVSKQVSNLDSTILTSFVINIKNATNTYYGIKIVLSSTTTLASSIEIGNTVYVGGKTRKFNEVKQLLYASIITVDTTTSLLAPKVVSLSEIDNSLISIYIKVANTVLGKTYTNQIGESMTPIKNGDKSLDILNLNLEELKLLENEIYDGDTIDIAGTYTYEYNSTEDYGSYRLNFNSNSDLTRIAKGNYELKIYNDIDKTEYTLNNYDRLGNVDLQEPNANIKEGYDFKGWAIDSTKDIIYTSNQSISMPNSNLSLYGIWEIQKFEIFFDSNLGTNVETQIVDYGAKVIAPSVPTRVNYIFAGWFTNTQLTQEFDFDTIIKETRTLYAKWTLVTVYLNTTSGNDLSTGVGATTALKTLDKALFMLAKGGTIVVSGTTLSSTNLDLLAYANGLQLITFKISNLTETMFIGNNFANFNIDGLGNEIDANLFNCSTTLSLTNVKIYNVKTKKQVISVEENGSLNLENVAIQNCITRLGAITLQNMESVFAKSKVVVSNNQDYSAKLLNIVNGKIALSSNLTQDSKIGLTITKSIFEINNPNGIMVDKKDVVIVSGTNYLPNQNIISLDDTTLLSYTLQTTENTMSANIKSYEIVVNWNTNEPYNAGWVKKFTSYNYNKKVITIIASYSILDNLQSFDKITGYSFDKFYADQNLTMEFDQNKAILTNTTIYSGWLGNKTTINLAKGESTNTPSVETIATYGDSQLAISVLPMKTGSTFTGFYSSSDVDALKVIDQYGKLIAGVVGFTDENGKWQKDSTSISLFPRFEMKPYTINIDNINGQLEVHNITGTQIASGLFNEEIVITKLNANSGFEFRIEGLSIVNLTTKEIISYTVENGNYKFNMPASDVKVRVEFIPLSFNLTYDLGYETEEHLADKTGIDFNSAVGELARPERKDYVFVNWQVGDDILSEQTIWRYTANKIAVAVWERKVKTLVGDGVALISENLELNPLAQLSIKNHTPSKELLKQIKDKDLRECYLVSYSYNNQEIDINEISLKINLKYGSVDKVVVVYLENGEKVEKVVNVKQNAIIFSVSTLGEFAIISYKSNALVISLSVVGGLVFIALLIVLLYVIKNQKTKRLERTDYDPASLEYINREAKKDRKEKIKVDIDELLK